MFVATSFYSVYKCARVSGANPDRYVRYAAETLLAGGEQLLPHEWLAAGSQSADTN